MSASWIENALAQLEAQINNCEQAVIRVIEDKKRIESKSMANDSLNRKLQYSPIAIVGMASLFPQSRTLEDYWENIIHQVDCITDVPESHWHVDDYFDPNPRTTKDKTYSKRGGFIPHVDFNPMEFGLPPNILEVTDVSQLLSLVIAKEAMEDAGYGLSREFNRDKVGVILGVAMARNLGIPLSARLQYPIWEKVLKSSGISDQDTQKIIEKMQAAYIKWDENAFPGMLANIVAGRIANRLNLGGINCVVDAACASSFAALKMAISELVEHRCDMMLTGGVDTDNSITAYISFSKTPALTPSDKVRPFDAKSDGMMLGEGIGILVLKRLEDAERDGDKIYAVIKGIGTSSDGRYKSIYAPRPEGQMTALRRAYEDAGFEPATVGLIEAHGTGTMAGDPTEFASLREYFGEENPRRQYIALGSVKSQIGHTKAAAGAASLIKTSLALYHKVLPPTINVTEPNPKFNIENTPFYINTQTRPWIRPQGEVPRRAGVSAFGFGGTNYHVVLEEYTGKPSPELRVHHTPYQILIDGVNPEELRSQLENLLVDLGASTGQVKFIELVKLSKEKEIPVHHARVGFVAQSREEAVKYLEIAIAQLKKQPDAAVWEHPQGVYYRQQGMELQGKVVALFSGQGSQYLEMGREVVMNFPVMQEFYGYMDSLLLKDNMRPLSDVVFPPPVFNENDRAMQVSALQRTEYAQPAIGMMSAGLYKILHQAGLKPDFVAGHSFGEITALWAAGVFSDADYCGLVKARGQAMAPPQDPDYDAGAMLAVRENLSTIEAYLKPFSQVSVANLNSPRQVVLAGPTEEITKVRQVLVEQGFAAMLLPVSAAFHTSLIAFAQKSFAIALKSTEFKPQQITTYSNVTAHPYPQEPQKIKQILETHLANPVLFKQQIENIYNAGGYCFVEFGPRRILTNLVQDILGERPHIAIALNPSDRKNSDRSLREAVVQLRVHGVQLQDIDPLQKLPTPPVPENPKALNVRLNGVNYVSPKTAKTIAEALQPDPNLKVVIPQSTVNKASTNGKTKIVDIKSEIVPGIPATSSSSTTSVQLPSGHSQKTPPDITTGVETSATNSPTQPSKPNPTSPVVKSTMEQVPNQRINYQQVLESLEFVLSQFQQNNSENLQVHGLYLNHQQKYVETFFQLLQQQHKLLIDQTSATNNIKSMVTESLERSMTQFSSQQAETLRVHEQYLQNQLAYTQNFFQFLQQEYQGLLSGQVRVTQAPVNPVVQKPIQEAAINPVVAPIPQKPIQEAAINPVVAPIPQKPVQEAATNPVPQPTPTTSIATPSIAAGDVAETLLAITSEKTGYPVEMLELDMDMEADLGIDSIKRVEILGAMQEAYPNLPQPNVEDLGELRTIGQVVNYIQSLMGQGGETSPVQTLTQVNTQSVNTQPTVAHVTTNIQNPIPVREPITVSATPSVDLANATTSVIPETPTPAIAIATTPVTTPIEPEVPASFGVNAEEMAQTLLNITSEKTGYPVEMLELDMDMEADLGIDSIKRVEILGAMQETYPDLPQPNVEDLGDLRTIGQIVNYLQTLTGGEKKNHHPQSELTELSQPQVNQPGEQATQPTTPTEPSTASLNNSPLRRQVFLKTLPQPDYLEFSLPEGHIGLITDDGTLTTTKLASELTHLGWRVVVLSFPETIVSQRSPLPSGIERVELDNMDEPHLQEKLNAICQHFGNIAAFIHVNPRFELNQNGRIPYIPSEKAVVKHVFFIAKHLKTSLNQAAKLGRACFCTVARLDGAFGLDHNLNYSPISAGLFGLTKTLNWEWEKVFCRAIDLNPTINADQSSKNIIAELHDPNRYITEVGYGLNGRTTLVSQ
ncbi:type I polyketide synthase [Calothrix sp. NIES-3974]|uniref:type I polyketide synthase n=1 Tax=Calothrix sp. NIES-3974 TaxID=2005462 RepID=UPI000B618431|nr:type I polyketide synthase [Calothrix sp. NIES-3974]BAZ06456.1 polyketide synthase phosphopantetheine-binding HglE [Calothrix sp. NIES-3974]